MSREQPLSLRPPAAAPAGQRVLDEAIRAEIREYFPRYPTRRAVVLPALHTVNRHLRHVPLAAVVEIAEMLQLAPAEVQDTLSFYGFFKQEAPQGTHRVWVCRSISCSACGSENLLGYLTEKLQVRPGQTTADGRFTLEYAECLGACDFAPAVLVDDTLHKNMNRQKLDQLLAELAAGGPGTDGGGPRK